MAMSIGEMIKLVRTELGIKQEELAEMTGLSRITISKYENGKVEPNSSTLRILADALETSADALLGRKKYIPSGSTIMLPGIGTVSQALPPETTQAVQMTDIGLLQTYEPDYEKAAVKALETLLRYGITSCPVLPMTILQAIPNVFVVSFTELADSDGLDRNNMVTLFGAQNQDVVTFKNIKDGETTYFVAYNQTLPFYMIQRSMARELGHILLGHTDAMPKETQIEEALYFSRHLLCPRPLIHAFQETRIKLTVKTIGNITGCYGRFLAGVRKTPGAHVPANLNRMVRDQLTGYVASFLNFKSRMPVDDDTDVVDFGTYMDNYEA